MCTYQTEFLEVTGSGKGPASWLRVTHAQVYVDHPVHAMAGHTLNIDLRNPAEGPAARVAIELHPTAARELAEAILRSLDAVPDAVLAAG
ncbi:MAG: hypothetical protein JO246_16005 [Frankiaceae bacterium]|nr:hypothetical protein [Frankiaceae bacterium]MBV9871655.1 hypothetical protein [Frankiaceae bacterium]